MNKTLHKKLTEKYHSPHAATLPHMEDDDMLSGFAAEISILNHAAKDLLQPRPEAVSGILKMARNL